MKLLRIMQKHECKIDYSTHEMMIRNLLVKIESELASKKKRETQVLQTLIKIKKIKEREKKSVTIKQLITAMHDDQLDEKIRKMTIKFFMKEMLRKLAKDRKMTFKIRARKKK